MAQVYTVEEHQARAMLLGKVYDSATHTYRPLSPEGSKYKYTDCLHADTLRVMEKGEVRDIERENSIGNVVSGRRTPGAPHWKPKKTNHFGAILGWEHD